MIDDKEIEKAERIESRRRDNEQMKKVFITVEGGVIQDISGSEGIIVTVMDYDIDGVENLVIDEHGDECVESIYIL